MNALHVCNAVTRVSYLLSRTLQVVDRDGDGARRQAEHVARHAGDAPTGRRPRRPGAPPGTPPLLHCGALPSLAVSFITPPTSSSPSRHPPPPPPPPPPPRAPPPPPWPLPNPPGRARTATRAWDAESGMRRAKQRRRRSRTRGGSEEKPRQRRADWVRATAGTGVGWGRCGCPFHPSTLKCLARRRTR